jgi:hypothetical protein
MKRRLLKGIGGGFSAALLLAALLTSSPAWASIPPQPGVINYVEGQAEIGNQPLSPNAAGSVKLSAGELLATQNGKTELLLTPGVFLRVADNSQIQMVSPDIANTIVSLQKGRAMVEVDRIYTANNIRMNLGNASVELVKPGLYDFDANMGQIRVFDGNAKAQVGGRNIDLKKGRELALNQAGKLKARDFDLKAYQDDFFRWASLRSSYLAEANIDAARQYANTSGQYVGAYPGYYGAGYYGAGWYGTGWYWDPWFDAYTFIPGDGIFYSPFGWGFYSPWLAVGLPFYGGYGFYHHFGPGYHSPYASIHAGFGGAGSVGHAHSVPGNGFAGGGFGGGFHGGGFGGAGFGGGGFHGGGFGGGGRR